MPMLRRSYSCFLIALIVLAGLAACQPQPTVTLAETPTQPAGPSPASPTPTPLIRETPAPTPGPTSTQLPDVGPDHFPPNVNPLTGLAVDDPAVLARRPLLVKVSNESEQVRPQSGLSFADHVWMYQMEGWGQTRFTAVYYSRAPEAVGSVRSVRLIDSDHLIPMYDGLIAMSGCSVGMCTVILNAPWQNRVFRDDGRGYLERRCNIPHEGMCGYHSLFALPARIWEEAERRGVDAVPDLDGLRFSMTAPPGGTLTTEVVIDYPGKGPEQTWRYDPASGQWLSWTEMYTQTEPTPDVDYLTGQQLAFDNVVIVYAEFYLADFIEDDANRLLSIGPILTGQGEAVLLRDGQRFEATWRRDDPEQMIQFFDQSGQLVPLKPGTVWFNVASVRPDQYPPTIAFAP